MYQSSDMFERSEGYKPITLRLKFIQEWKKIEEKCCYKSF